jgi:uncharacterized protein (TIGR03435 family)
MDVYVVTSADRKPPAAKPQDFGVGGSSSSWFESAAPDGTPEGSNHTGHGIHAVSGISLEGTVDEFCKTLERDLDRPVVNETNLKGRFAFRVKVPDDGKTNFLDALRDQLGLTVTTEQRNVDILVFNPR